MSAYQFPNFTNFCFTDCFPILKSLFGRNNSTIDNQIFRLHHQVTFIILLAFSVLVTSRQYFGDPIYCLIDDNIPLDLLNTFCWIHSTFSIDNAWTKRVGEEVPYPGIDRADSENKQNIYHAYYQWVCFVLLFQALLFRLPIYFWNNVEAGLIKNLILNLDQPILSNEERTEKLKVLVDYLVKNRGHHNAKFALFVVAEVANLFNVVAQMALMDWFLGNQFTDYGWKVIEFADWDSSIRFDPMVRVFPKMTKCRFHRFGPSGDVQRHDALCLLPINAVNEKIYIFLWFWFKALACLSLLVIVYRVLIVCEPNVRVVATQTYCRFASSAVLKDLVKRLLVGDWFLLNLLAKNLDPINFSLMIEEMQKRLNEK